MIWTLKAVKAFAEREDIDFEFRYNRLRAGSDSDADFVCTLLRSRVRKDVADALVARLVAERGTVGHLM